MKKAIRNEIVDSYLVLSRYWGCNSGRVEIQAYFG